MVTSGFGIRRVVVVAAVLVSMGCYTVKPITGQGAALGTTVALGISDAGRVSLGGQMGPGIREVEGRLLEKDSANYVLAVAQVRLLNGGEQVWSGERIRIRTEDVTTVNEKKFSRGKTALIGAAAVGLVAVVLSKGLIGGAAGDEGKTPPDTGITIRYPRFGR